MITEIKLSITSENSTDLNDKQQNPFQEVLEKTQKEEQ